MRERLARALAGLAALALGLAAVLAGLGFLLAAVYLALGEVWPPAAAAAATAVVALIAAGVLILLARALARPPRAPRTGDEAADEPRRDATGLGSVLGPLAREHFPAAAGATFLAGLVLGLSPRARRALWRVIQRNL